MPGNRNVRLTMVDSIYRTRSLGVATEGLRDQYADGKAAKVWEVYIGDKKSRTEMYCKFMTKVLREHSCNHVLDVACGTGVDSLMLLEQGFRVTSVDASDKMLKYALKERWNRRKEPSFDQWEIEEANWLTLTEDIHKPGKGYDAVICLGNSFAHLPDFTGDLREIKTALKNFADMLKPGGILIIDHRNYDYILETGKTPAKNIYYNSKHIKDIDTSILFVNNNAVMVTLDYTMDISDMVGQFDSTDSEVTKRGRYWGSTVESLLMEAFGQNCKHQMYGDFEEQHDSKEPPAFYIHIVEKL